MELGEEILLRIVIILMLSLFVYAVRLVLALIKKGVGAIFKTGNAPKAPVQPPKPPVIPNQPPKPPVLPDPPHRPQPVQKAEYYEGTIQLRDGTDPIPGRQEFQLRALNGPLMGSTYLLRGTVTIGRNPASHIVFPAETPAISGNHCQVTVHENGYGIGGCVTVTDTGSTYGTFLGNGQRILPNQHLQINPGEIFWLGGSQGCAFRLETK